MQVGDNMKVCPFSVSEGHVLDNVTDLVDLHLAAFSRAWKQRKVPEIQHNVNIITSNHPWTSK